MIGIGFCILVLLGIVVMTPAYCMLCVPRFRTSVKQDGVQQLCGRWGLARLTLDTQSCTLPREKRYARRTNPVKSACTSTTHKLSERAGVDTCVSTLHSKIDCSELAAKMVLRERLCYVRSGTTFNPGNWIVVTGNLQATINSTSHDYKGSDFMQLFHHWLLM